jgi:hypothetical protein
MTTQLTLREVMGRVAQLTSSEVVAVLRQLIASFDSDFDPVPPFGPPSIDNVHLQSDGSVVCPGCATTPAVLEIGILLDSLLSRDTSIKVAGALRYTIARALLDVNAPPFDSIADLAAAFERHEPGDCQRIVADLYTRATANVMRVRTAGHERRRSSPSVAELRRQLRQADEERFRLTAAAIRSEEAAPDPVITVRVVRTLPDLPPVSLEAEETVEETFPDLLLRADAPQVEDDRTRFRAAPWLIGGALAASVAFGAGYVIIDQMRSLKPPVQSNRAGAFSQPDEGARAVYRADDGARRFSSSDDGARGFSRADDRSAPEPPGDVERSVPDIVRAVSPENGPSFSPAFASNGTALFFHTGRSSDSRSALETATLGGDDLQVMTILDDGARNYHVQPSPDGDHVAFDSDRDGERGVYIANRDGTEVHRVSGAGYAAVPTWSPDSKRLAFVRAETDRPDVWNLWLLDTETGDMRRLTSFTMGQTWGASWFTDGNRICYTHEDRLLVRDLRESGTTREYLSPVPNRLVRTPAVSPDGTHVIFQVARSGAWLLDLTDGSMRCVLTDPTAEEFAWSPDGRRVAFHSRRDGQWGIWLLAPAS